MINLISIKDPHLSLGFLNRIRYDYQRDITGKLDFIRQFIIDKKVNDIILTGDITDSNYDRKWSFRQYVKNKRAFENLKVNNNVEILSCVGNHDMFNGLEDSQDTVFDELVRENIIKNITRYPKVYNESVPTSGTKTKQLKIYGVNFSNNMETILNNLKVINNDTFINTEYFKIVVMHNNLTPNKERLTELIYSELAKEFPNINMFIAGHYHIGFPTEKIDNTYFVNNWNLTRVVRDYDVTLDQHTPEFEFIQFDDNYNLINIETIKVPCGKYDETFIPNAVNIIKKSKQEIFEFFQINFEDIINKQSDEEILTQFEYEQDIVELALKYLNGD
jgi:DNA repair exonuclease SbcCD nuclease subunit